MDYILGPRDEGCVFCEVPALDDERESLLLARGERAYVVMNRYPYSNGHLLVCPYRHVADPLELEAAERHEMDDLVVRCLGALRETMQPQGFNLGANLGHVAGAGIASHVHRHVVPRWLGDTNFMPVVGLASVMPQHLGEAYDLLRPLFDGAAGAGEVRP